MGNSVTLNVLAASSTTAGDDPAVRAGEVDLDAVTGEWEVQWLLPFLWMGLVPEPWFAAHADRLLAALAAGEDESPGLTDVVVPWPTAAEAFRTRLPAVVAVWPEFAEPANRFLSDVTSVAERTTNPVIRLQLDELVTASWGGSSLPRDEPVPLPAPSRAAPSAPHDARVDRQAETPRVPRPSWINERQWAGRYGIHGEDLWQVAALAAARKARAQANVWPWHWMVAIAVTFAVVTWLIVGMFSDSMLWATIAGAVVLVSVAAMWGRAAGRARRS
ncbi:hypothetical protein ITJ50_15790 [Curtobacterium sp. VKM Ac-2889]|uniref:hypothetical protein n=1 Tax=unclassified Curtobacterium TaxID=257496 RepID=UPI00188D6EDE|nr:MULTISPECIES: hypothetical protein [unclassified Curtobacterium]MBF4597522.1 hypothetical protein [Curtobacterium sp. VKM Ac-1796]MBF4612682.1 hypothetical protein [Curtobacterium sp. VKM Ac-2889]